MAELTTKERLQPSLLDRLTDDAPDKKAEPREQRVLSGRKLRECVLRDLAWLMNTGNLEATEDLEDHPHVAASVVNYGMPDFAGCFASTINVAAVERLVREALWRFEPRILRRSVSVKPMVSETEMHTNALTFEIEGVLWGQPMPERLFLKTEIDLEDGHVTISDLPFAGVD